MHGFLTHSDRFLQQPGSDLLGSFRVRCAISFGAARSCSELLGAARSCSELLGAARSCSELLGAARSSSELLEAAQGAGRVSRMV